MLEVMGARKERVVAEVEVQAEEAGAAATAEAVAEEAVAAEAAAVAMEGLAEDKESPESPTAAHRALPDCRILSAASPTRHQGWFEAWKKNLQPPPRPHHPPRTGW